MGFPKTDARRDDHPLAQLRLPGATPGVIRQYFQAAVLEFHPASAEPVQISLIGDALRNSRCPDDNWQGFAAFDPTTRLEVSAQLPLLGARPSVRPRPLAGLVLRPAFPQAGYDDLVGFEAAPGERSRMFAVQRGGRIVAVPLDRCVAPSKTPFLDLTDRVFRAGREEGLLSLAFDPDFQQNGYLYVYYTTAPLEARSAQALGMAIDPSAPITGPSAGPASSGLIAPVTTGRFNYRGPLGSVAIEIQNGDTLNDAIARINAREPETGVRMALVKDDQGRLNRLRLSAEPGATPGISAGGGSDTSNFDEAVGFPGAQPRDGSFTSVRNIGVVQRSVPFATRDWPSHLRTRSAPSPSTASGSITTSRWTRWMA